MATSRNVSYGDVPFQERWERLKPIITQLYVNENKKLAEVVAKMKEEHGFDAVEDQYKYHFKKWKIKKNFSRETKRKLLDKGQERADAGKRTAFSVRNKPVDSKRLLREVKRDSKREIALKPTASGQLAIQQFLLGFQFGPSIFMAWNMPYGVLAPDRILGTNHGSPGQVVSSPSDIMASTPPANARSPISAPSPLSKALAMKRPIDRARLFTEGRFDDLIKSMNKKEAEVMSSWLHQFWYFAFKAAKYWGVGPPTRTAARLGFETWEDWSSRTQGIAEPDDIAHNTASPEYRVEAARKPRELFQPSPLCRWSIHYECKISYEESPEESHKENRPWQPPFQETLVSALESNDFSSIKSSELPVAVPQIVKATAKSPDVLLREALGFAIMGRNVELTEQLWDRFVSEAAEIRDFYPLHLAISFLDGVTSCCNVFSVFVCLPPAEWTLRYLRDIYVNNLGHTVLDSLMISILKSHTSTTPGDVDEELRHQKRFAGEEVDVCGRWDADSECFRALLNTGEGSVPMTWKHKFCHTSSQAICHCIMLIYSSEILFDRFDLPSGIFLKHCSECGLKMQLQPLHTLVVTAFHLANNGCTDEDLFGMLACLLTLLYCEVDPTKKADVSAESLFGRSSKATGCTHERLTPAELADRVPTEYAEVWSERTRTGWEILRLVLWISQSSTSETSDLRDQEYDPEACCDYHEIPKMSPILATLFAAVQTELLTYRRLREGDPWVSENFDLVALSRDLREGDENLPSIGLVQKKALETFL